MAKTYVTVLGIILIVIGALGFVSPLAPNGAVFGVFAADTDHNLVHLVSGLVALGAVAAGGGYIRLYAKVFGIVYGLVAVLGFVVGEGDVLGVVNVNQADNVLHLIIAASALYVGFASTAKKAQA